MYTKQCIQKIFGTATKICSGLSLAVTLRSFNTLYLILRKKNMYYGKLNKTLIKSKFYVFYVLFLFKICTGLVGRHRTGLDTVFMLSDLIDILRT